VSAHLDPELIAGLTTVERTDPERTAAEAHARDCSECRAAWDDATARLADLDALAAPPPPSRAALASAKSAVLARMREERPARSAAGGDPEPEVSISTRRAAIRAASAIPVLSLAAFVALALTLRSRTEIAWGVGLGLVAIVSGRTALSLVRGGARDAGFALALGAAVSALLVWIDATGMGEGHGRDCISVELAGAALPVLAKTGLVWRGAMRPTGLGFAAVAVSGALAGQLALRAACPNGHLEHLATFHFGGVLVAGLLGALIAQTPALRRRAT
jgi:hypothetical protein